jgi:transposase
MDAIRKCCAGLDVHQESITACILDSPLDRKPKPLIKNFGTTTRELLQLQDWLAENKWYGSSYGKHRCVLEIGMEHP